MAKDTNTLTQSNLDHNVQKLGSFRIHSIFSHPRNLQTGRTAGNFMGISVLAGVRAKNAMSKKKETGLLLQISQDGSSIRVLHQLIEREKAQVKIREMARNGVEAKYFPEKTVDEFKDVIGHLNSSLKKHRQRTIRVLHKEV